MKKFALERWLSSIGLLVVQPDQERLWLRGATALGDPLAALDSSQGRQRADSIPMTTVIVT